MWSRDWNADLDWPRDWNTDLDWPRDSFNVQALLRFSQHPAAVSKRTAAICHCVSLEQLCQYFAKAEQDILSETVPHPCSTADPDQVTYCIRNRLGHKAALECCGKGPKLLSVKCSSVLLGRRRRKSRTISTCKPSYSLWRPILYLQLNSATQLATTLHCGSIYSKQTSRPADVKPFYSAGLAASVVLRRIATCFQWKAHYVKPRNTGCHPGLQ